MMKNMFILQKYTKNKEYFIIFLNYSRIFI